MACSHVANKFQALNGRFEGQPFVFTGNQDLPLPICAWVPIMLDYVAQSFAQHINAQITRALFIENPSVLGPIGIQQQVESLGNVLVSQSLGPQALFGQRAFQMGHNIPAGIKNSSVLFLPGQRCDAQISEVILHLVGSAGVEIFATLWAIDFQNSFFAAALGANGSAFSRTKPLGLSLLTETTFHKELPKQNPPNWIEEVVIPYLFYKIRGFWPSFSQLSAGTAISGDEFFCIVIAGKRPLGLKVLGVVVAFATIHTLYFIKGVQQFMVENVGDDKTWNARRIKHRADRNCMVRRIVVSQAPPTLAHSPSQIADFYLVIEVATVELRIQFLQRMILARGSVNPLAPPAHTPLSHTLFHPGILPILFICGGNILRGPAAHHLAGQYQHDCLNYIPRRPAAMVTDADNPASALAADCMG
jgi:hypothetical protein